MNPLQPKRSTQNLANKWHRDVFKLRGNKCFFCGSHATDAMHILRRGMHLGPLRYADPHFGAPGCRRCHELEDVGKLAFPLELRIEAVTRHNAIAKIPMQIPWE